MTTRYLLAAVLLVLQGAVGCAASDDDSAESGSALTDPATEADREAAAERAAQLAKERQLANMIFDDYRSAEPASVEDVTSSARGLQFGQPQTMNVSRVFMWTPSAAVQSQLGELGYNRELLIAQGAEGPEGTFDLAFIALERMSGLDGRAFITCTNVAPAKALTPAQCGL